MSRAYQLPADAAFARLQKQAADMLELLDVARNIAAIDDAWLAKAHPRLLRAAIREIRDEARAAIDKAGVEP